MGASTSPAFDAYVLYLYIVLGHPAKEIAEHQGISKEDVSEILRRYGFNYRNTYGAGQHFKAYPAGKNFRLKDGRTVQLEITQSFLEAYVKSGNFYDNAFEDYINRYYAPDPKPSRTPKPRPDKPAVPPKEPEEPQKSEQPDQPTDPAPSREKKPLPPRLRTLLKILACVLGAALIVFAASCAGCIRFDEISCAGCDGYSPNIGGSETAVFEIHFSAADNAFFEVTILLDGTELNTLDLTVSDTAIVSLEGVTGTHIIEAELDGKRSNPLTADMDANSVMYVVISIENGTVHISQTSE